jgi:ABC-type multidrug transport system fused ATPase/permease subunit
VLVLLLLPGDLRFEGVCLRYFPGGPLALRHVNFHVQDCEKVGQMKQGASHWVGALVLACRRSRFCS